MPYFGWRGVDIRGNTRRGSIFARSEQELDRLLLKQDIALLTVRQKQHTWFTKPITVVTQIQFFRQLASLLKAGLLLPDALAIVGSQMSNIKFQAIIMSLADQVVQGKKLSTALQEHRLFDDITIVMMAVGHEAGTVSETADIVADYMQGKHQLSKQLRAGAIMPGITLLFFLAIMLMIFIFIIPIFADLFASAHKQLPSTTQLMIEMSNWMRNWYTWIAIGIFSAAAILCLRMARSSVLFDKLMVQLPLIGSLIKQKSLIYFTRALSLLLKSGVQLVPALTMAQKAVHNHVLQGHLTLMQQDVMAGSTLSDAMARQPWFGQESVAMVLVGQESGQLSDMLYQVATLHEEQMKQKLAFIVKVFQPLLMLILGLLVTALLFSIYLPIFTLSQVIGG